MNCGEVQELIQLYLDSELDARNTLDAQRHVESCSACSRLLDAFQKQDRALKQAARAETPDSCALRASIRRAIRERSPRAASLWLPLPILKRVAAIMIVASIATLLVLEGGLLPGANDSVYAAAISDHAAHCTLDKLTMAITNSDEVNRLAAEYGRVEKTPDLSAFGFGGPRAKVCLVNDAKTLHLVFHAAGQQPLSLFLRPHGSDLKADQLIVHQRDGYRIGSVSRSGTLVLIVSSLDDRLMTAISQAIVAQL